MNGWFNPDNWLDVADHLLLILGAMATLIIPPWISSRKTHRDLKDVKDQVKNGHTNTNLRDDLDRVLERLEELSRHVTEIARGFSGLKSELIDEEIHRRESIKELRFDLREGISQIEGRLTGLEGQIKPNG
jgi:predicted RNase H-like nuclease (RuvC/YqgF family)